MDSNRLRLGSVIKDNMNVNQIEEQINKLGKDVIGYLMSDKISRKEGLKKLLDFYIEKTILTGEGFAMNSLGQGQSFKRSGYAVAFTDQELKPENRKEVVRKCIDWLIDSEADNKICGAWIDGDAIFVDLALNIDNYADAVFLAGKFKQKAIWSYAEKRAIYKKEWKEKKQ